MTQAIRKTAPEPLAPISFNIPRAFQNTLPNGLRIVIFEDHRLPLVSFRLAFLSGDVNDPENAGGLTSAMAAMMTEGTLNYTSRALAEKIERLGAGISASSSADFTVLSASTLSLYDTEILELMAEIVFRPVFPEDELDLYKRNSIENLKFQRSQPNFLANEQTARILYDKHPYSKISPTAEDVEKLSRDQLIDFHARNLIPNNAVFIAVGAVERDTLAKQIEEQFGHWNVGDIEPVTFYEPPERTETTITIVDRPGSAQSNIVLANLALDRNNPDYFAITVMNQVLGAGASSRVFMNLREEKGYTYGAYTRIDAKHLAGDFEATAEVRTSVTGDSLKEFFYELRRIRDEKVAESELNDAKNFLTGVFPIRAETQEGLTNLILAQQIHNLPDDYLETYRAEIDRITADDVQRVAKKYIHPDRIAIVIVGDAEEMLPQVRTFGENIEVFDAEGKPKSIADFDKTFQEHVNVRGKWNLVLDFQGQQMPVTMLLEQTGGNIEGELETMLGNGIISGGKVKGNKLTASAATEIQGRSMEFVISATADGNSLTGSISAPMIPDPLSFTGSREKAAEN